MNNGVAASCNDNSAHGEDAFLTRELSLTASLDAVLDGVTHCEGGYASNFTAQLLQEAPIESLSGVTDVLEEANNTLYLGGRGHNLLTTVSVALKVEDELHLISAGDSPVYLIRGREVLELTPIARSSSLPGVAGGAVGLHESFTYVYKKVRLQPHDRIVLATDGLSNNVFPEEVAEIVRKYPSPTEAIAGLEELVSEKRRLHTGRQDSYGTFREDDWTAIIRYLE